MEEKWVQRLELNCAFCGHAIPETETATEFMAGDRLQHLSLACEDCKSRSSTPS